MLPVLAGCDVLPDFRRAVNSAAWTIVPIKITDELLMSALGQKQTFECVRAMSALPPKADIDAPDKEHERRFVVSAPSVGRRQLS